MVMGYELVNMVTYVALWSLICSLCNNNLVDTGNLKREMF